MNLSIYFVTLNYDGYEFVLFECNQVRPITSYADAKYISDLHNGQLITNRLFVYMWWYNHLMVYESNITVTSPNHAKLLALHAWGASSECVWLKSVIQNIRKTCGLFSEKIISTILYEDNSAWIPYLKEGYYTLK